jgi:hypothetical protein
MRQNWFPLLLDCCRGTGKSFFEPCCCIIGLLHAGGSVASAVDRSGKWLVVHHGWFGVSLLEVTPGKMDYNEI